MYLIQKPVNSTLYGEVAWYPHALSGNLGPQGWAIDLRGACHYATRELAEQVIENLKKSGVDVTGARVVDDPLPVGERIGIAMRRRDDRWDYY
jgi:hypothetical protein